MEIKREKNGHRGAFYADSEGERAAEMTYSLAGKERMIIDHTEVSEDLRGTGTGKALVYAGVEFARKKGLRVVPLCPFAKAIIDKTPQLQDVL